MNSSKPYLFRALYEWIVDNDCTPHMVVDANGPGVLVPLDYVNKNGEIVLNVAPDAVLNLSLDNDAVSFSARFSGVSNDIFVPTLSILGIYARENGRGMMFDPEPVEPPPPEEPPKKSKPQNVTPLDKNKKAGLRLVK